MSLPAPENYSNWQSWARAVNAALAEAGFDPFLPQVVGQGIIAPPAGGGGSGGSGGGAPAGFAPLWTNLTTSEIFAGNEFLAPPDAGDLFQIDNADILDAAISANKIQDAAVGGSKLTDASINLSLKAVDATLVSAKIADAAIVTAKIGELQVVSGKIADLSVNNAKMANASVDSIKIANAGVAAINILDGNVIRIKIGDTAINTAKIEDATITQAKIALAAIGTALIQNAAITQALIGLLAVGSAQIQDLSVGTAKLQDLAVTTAKIGDAQITSAKIASLVVDKIAGGTLGVDIDVGAGMLTFAIGGNKLMLGRGFGTSSQFFMWFGPDSFTKATATEASAVMYLKTNGDAYFGGSLSSGVLRNEATSTTTTDPVSVIVGPFASNGDPINVNMSYFFRRYQEMAHGTGSIGAAPAIAATLTLQYRIGAGSWVNLTTWYAYETARSVVIDGDPLVRDQLTWETQGGSTYVWTPGVGAEYELRLSADRVEPTFNGSSPQTPVLTQRTGVIAVES